MGRKRRGLTDDDIAIWRQVAETAEPLHPKTHKPVVHATPKPKHRHVPAISPFDIGQTARATTPRHDLMPSVDERVHAAPLRMDRKSFGKMKRGKLRPEGKLDLHGMTLAAAHPALTGFVMAAHGDGKRLVLVVTGKGKDRADDGPIPIRRGVLRHQVPQWLAMPPLGAVVLQVTQAHISHGGAGAYYVYLRRGR